LSYVTLELVIPEAIMRRLERVSKERGLRVEDLIMRAIVKVIEEFETPSSG